MVLQIKFVPFNPTDKYTIGTIKPADGAETFRLMKGAPQVPAIAAPVCPTHCKAHGSRLQRRPSWCPQPPACSV
jgi:hypothetical protein